VTLRLSARQIALLAEMGVVWAPLLAPRRRSLRWVALTADAPTESEGRLLRNILRAVEACFPADTRHAALSEAYRGGPPLDWLRNRFDPEGERNLGVLLFGGEASTLLLGSPGVAGQVLHLEHCSVAVARTLAEITTLADAKPRLWRAVCEVSERLLAA